MYKLYPKKTISRQIYIEGIGIHSGEKCTVKLTPRSLLDPAGIYFKKLSFSYLNYYPNKLITPESIYNTDGCITVSDEINRHSIRTIEHLMAALRAHNISNLLIENLTEEIPILDGSAIDYYNVIKETGVIENKIDYIEPIVIKKKEVIIADNNQFIIAAPSSDFNYEMNIVYSVNAAHLLLENKTIEFKYSTETAAAEILPARTFGYLKDIDKLKASNKALGASEKNAVILTDNATLNPLRFPDELVRHKILDFIGDLYTIGRPVIGDFTINSGNHKLHIALAKKLYKDYVIK